MAQVVLLGFDKFITVKTGVFGKQWKEDLTIYENKINGDEDPDNSNTQAMIKGKYTRLDNQTNKGAKDGMRLMVIQTNVANSQTLSGLFIPDNLRKVLTSTYKKQWAEAQIKWINGIKVSKGSQNQYLQVSIV